MSEIKIVRLTSGEELLATVDLMDNGYVLNDIAVLIPTQQNQLGLAPFMPYAVYTKGIEFQSKDIMFVTEPVDALREQYQTMFGHVITPRTNIIA